MSRTLRRFGGRVTGSFVGYRWSFPVPALLLALLLAACAPSATFPAGNAADPIAIAVAPAAGLSQVESAELAAQLHGKTGLSFQSFLYPSSADAIGALASGKAQIGWMGSLGYVSAHKRYGVEVGLVAVRRGSDHFNSHIIANARAGIKTLGDLKGKAFCFPNSAAAESYTISRIILQANSVDLSRDLRVNKVDSDEQITAAVYAADQCVAGATAGDARKLIQNRFPDVMEQVLVLDASADIPNDAITFVKAFPADSRGHIADVLGSIANTEDGKRLLHVQGLIKQQDAAYNRLRDLLTKAGTDPANYIR